jgi:hypothetical protein
MDTQKNIDSIERDNNLQMLKDIVDSLTARIEKLEKNKLDKPREGYVVKTEKVELFDE